MTGQAQKRKTVGINWIRINDCSDFYIYESRAPAIKQSTVITASQCLDLTTLYCVD